jgi:hypothetical protein
MAALRGDISFRYLKQFFLVQGPTKVIMVCDTPVHKTQDEDKQSRDTVNVWYTRHRTKTDNLETLSTWGTQNTGRRQSRDTVNVGYTRHRTKTNNLETLSTWGTQDTGRRQSRDTVKCTPR